MKNNSAIEQIIKNADDLPSLPLVTQKIMQMTSRPDTSLSEIAAVVSSDAALVVRILKIVNSAYYGFKTKTTNILQAMTILGIKGIRNIAVTLSIIDLFPTNHAEEYEILFKRSLTAAVAADFIIKIEEKSVQHNVFLAGLLQNLGTFILMRYLPEQYLGILKTAKEYALDQLVVEEAELGTNHIRIGSMVSKHWDLPLVIRAGIEYKRNIKKALSLNIPNDAKLMLQAVYIGGIAADIYWGSNKVRNIGIFKKELAYYFNYKNTAAENILSSLPHLVEDTGFTESSSGERIKSYETMIKEANSEIKSSIKSKEKIYMDLVATRRLLEEKTEALKKLKRSNKGKI